jgi:signal transduction histidine kinase
MAEETASRRADVASVSRPTQPPTETGRPAQWLSLVDGAMRSSRKGPPTVGRVVGRFIAANLIGVALLLAASTWASQRAAEDEALVDARRATDLMAAMLVQPNLDQSLTTGDSRAVAKLDGVLRGRLAAADVMRVKIWTRDGRIVYSDEPRLIGSVYPLSEDDVQAMRDGNTRAELSDLSRPENRFERSAGQLLEVYRQILSPAGDPMLLETYTSYRQATARQRDIWLKFAPISASVLLALLLIQLPLARRMVTQLRATQQERELLQARALDTSTEERRRIAGRLHDGIVQDVSASALLVAGAADKLRENARAGADEEETDVLTTAATALRESVGSLRSLLVEIYPPTLERAGLASALADLAARLRPRGIDVRIEVPDTIVLPPEVATLFFRTAQEALLNVAKHAQASIVGVAVREQTDRLVLEIADDGVGFDLPSIRARPRHGHLGLSVLTDLAAANGASLALRTAPGEGTILRLEVPRA